MGLDPDLRTGVVLFGVHGSPAMLDIARLADESDNEVQLIMLCGHNEKLASDLRGMKTKRPMMVEGFTSQVDHYMSLADFSIGKHGLGMHQRGAAIRSAISRGGQAIFEPFITGTRPSIKRNAQAAPIFSGLPTNQQVSSTILR